MTLLKTASAGAALLSLTLLLGCPPPPGDDAGEPADAGRVDGEDGGQLVGDAGSTDAGSTDAGNTDAGNTDAGNTDAGNTDAGNTDAGNNDAGAPVMDGGQPASDAGLVVDAGAGDAGAGTDAGEDDAGHVDAGDPIDAVDGGTAADAGRPDAGVVDAGTAADAGSPDAGDVDAGPLAPAAQACVDAELLVHDVGVQRTTDGNANLFAGSCVQAGPDAVFRFVTGADVVDVVAYVDSTDDDDLGIYVRSACEDDGTELQCADNVAAGNVEFVTLTDVAAGTELFVFVDGFRADDVGSFEVGVYEVRHLNVGDDCTPGDHTQPCPAACLADGDGTFSCR